MEKKQDPAGQAPDKKPSLLGSNMIWILLGVGVLTLVLVNVMTSSSVVKIKYSDLVALVEQHEVPIDEGTVRRISRGDLITLAGGGPADQFFDLDDVVMGPTRIVASVRQRPATASEEDSPAETDQRVQITLSRGAIAADLWERENQRLQSRLTVANIPFDVIRGYHTIHDKGNKKTYRYSNLSDVVFGPNVVSGKIIQREVGATDVENSKTEPIKFLTSKGYTSEAEDKVIGLMSARGIDFKMEDGPSAWKAYIPLLLTMGLILVLIFFMMKRLGGAGSPMAFGRSRGKMYGQDDVGITFDDVAGIDEAREELREVVEFLRLPEKYQALGGRIPKGVLLVGPPGTGKTLLAKAIAGEAGVPFFGLSGSDFVEMFVGVGAARVRDMFQQAASRSPSIIFIDELDALGKTRGSGMMGGHDEREQTLNALLVEMDGFESNNGVIVMAATNRPETLDPALLRPGRFDRQVLVDRPDIRGREEILKVHVQNVKLDDTVDLKDIAGITSGFVGADLANLINEAALLAARKDKKSVGMDEFNDAVERVTAGLEKKERYIHEDEKQRVAYHEAGHALVAYCLPNTDPVHKVSIIPRGMAALGYTMQRPQDDRYLMTQSELESRIQVLLAGTITEEIIYEDISTGAQNDLERASEIARSMVMEFGMSRLGRVNFRESNRSPFVGGGGEFGHGPSHSEQTAREIDEEVKRIIDESIEKVRDILVSRKTSLIALTERLIEKEVVDATELKRVMEESTAIPQVVPGTSGQAAKRSVTSETEDQSSRDQAEG